MVIQMDKKICLDLANKKKKGFDQIASMHFKLSDKYKLFASIEDTVEIVVSVLLCGVTFLNCEQYFHISPSTSSFIIGFASIFLFAFTLIKQNWGHKELCEKHRLAGKMYAKAKLDLSARIKEWEIKAVSDSEVLTYLDDHYTALNDLPQIPEKYFAYLKHAPQTKVEFSRFLDVHPTDFLWVCKLKFRLGIACCTKEKSREKP